MGVFCVDRTCFSGPVTYTYVSIVGKEYRIMTKDVNKGEHGAYVVSHSDFHC